MTTNTNRETNPDTFGDPSVRRETIAGLRALADFLEANPSVPVNEIGQVFMFFTRDCDDAAAVALVDHVAELLDADVHDTRSRGGHYTASRSFGPISYRIVHIPARAAAEHAARHSYRDNVIPDTPTDEATRPATDEAA
ncbi:hypothetical protein GCM10023085_38970 [Actinomadura viridis]|uniref:Uncharacterized protein n=1 Tax=Actinomadura viridis TaxID=58110 RepID=A0A931DMR9_9ACTN|nr:hypothetical protein [Actinomadura viridis]MBG6092815.1 hypothetical protein [Actinomadura viridis]